VFVAKRQTPPSPSSSSELVAASIVVPANAAS
jgi:hypothetical protein